MQEIHLISRLALLLGRDGQNPIRTIFNAKCRKLGQSADSGGATLLRVQLMMNTGKQIELFSPAATRAILTDGSAALCDISTLDSLENALHESRIRAHK